MDHAEVAVLVCLAGSFSAGGGWSAELQFAAATLGFDGGTCWSY